VLDVREKPNWQERRNAQSTVERMIYGNWGKTRLSASADDRKSAVFDRKQTFSDKKTAFR
jgi:hypothetical protein